MKRPSFLLLCAVLPGAALAGTPEQNRAIVEAMPGLVAFWTFGEAPGTPRVSSGTRRPYPLSEVGGPIARVAGGSFSGYAAELDGRHYFSLPYAATGELNISGPDAQVSMFAVVRIVDLEQSRTIAGMWSEGRGANDDTGTRQYALLMNMPTYGGARQLVPHISAEGGVTRRADGSAFPWNADYAATRREVPEEKWCTLGFTYDGRYIRAYIDGVLDERALDPVKDRRTDRYFTQEGPGGKDRGMNPYYHGRGIFRYDPVKHAATKPRGGSDFTVGARMAVGSMFKESTKGRFAGLAVFNRALTDAEMRRLHEAADLAPLERVSARAIERPAELAARTQEFIEARCANCHNDVDQEAGLDLTSLTFAPSDPENRATWVEVHDRVARGEMPPKGKRQPEAAERAAFLAPLATALTAAERAALAAEGRATQRRLNRHEYENAVRDLLGAPWLELKDALPEDGEAHRFNKVGEALDLSHVNLARYLHLADDAVRRVVARELNPPAATVTRHYAREQKSFVRRMTFSALDQRADRCTFPVLGTQGQPGVRALKQPLTVGAADPGTREREAMGVVASTYEPLYIRFDTFQAPVAGRYKVRVSAYSVWVGPGTPTAARPDDWRMPDLNTVSRGRRPEPVALYAEIPPGHLRRLGVFDAGVEPTTGELEVHLMAGETIRPDCVRFFRSRPGKARNPLAIHDGMPGVAFRWLEVEGPLPDATTGGRPLALLGDAAARKTAPLAEAQRLLGDFVARAYRRPVDAGERSRFLPLIARALTGGASFAEAMTVGYAAVLCSPSFLRLEERPGPLDDHALASRLAFFLWNSPPDSALRQAADRGELRRPEILRAQIDRMIDSPNARRFVDAFLDYWLDLRRLQATAPDAALYSDYYLDDWLVDSAQEETRLFFAELLRKNLPARTIVAADFAMLNERLALHYDLPPVDGAALRRVLLPPESVRGGLLTQASVLKVTANGTTTSPVLRGAWVMERILGLPPPPPPPGVPAVEPDIRGATTIRELLERHRADRSCAACHAKIDPTGFALENFDVLGGWRSRYRAIAPGVPPAPGRGKSGYEFVFHHAQAVDASGELWDGRRFADVRELKRRLLADERQIARNLAQQLAVYATGAPVRFSDRPAIERVLDRAASREFGVRSLIHELVGSELFLNK